MNQLTIKEVNFNGAQLMAAQDKEDNKIYVGASFICNGIGLTEGQRDRQTKNIQSDIVLKQGAKKLSVKFDGQIREVLCLELDFLPLWLAKIEITPTMLREQPELTEKLVEYQLKAKDVLAEAFLSKVIRKKPVDIAFRQNMNMAKIMTTYTGISDGIAFAVAIKRTEMQTGEDLTDYKNLLPPIDIDVEIGTLNATELGKKVDLSSRATNILLEKHGLQSKDSKQKWRLTDDGKQYGEEFPYNNHGHSDYRILWKESAAGYLKNAMRKDKIAVM